MPYAFYLDALDFLIFSFILSYLCSYLTFRHVLRKKYEVGKIRLVAAEA